MQSNLDVEGVVLNLLDQVEVLNAIIDDIDTASDIFKPDLKDPYVQYVMNKIRQAQIVIHGE